MCLYLFTVCIQFFRGAGRVDYDGGYATRKNAGVKYHDERNAENGERCFCVYALEFSPSILKGAASGRAALFLFGFDSFAFPLTKLFSNLLVR